MALSLTDTAVPLNTDAEGVIRVGATRVTLDTLVDAFLRGATAEEIVQQYPSLDLGDVYAVIGFYLHRRDDVDGYLLHRQQQAEMVKQQNEARYNPAGVRERLMARRANSRA